VAYCLNTNAKNPMRLRSTAVLLVVASYISCDQTSPKEERSKFYYYPELNAYYNSQQSEFLYTVDGGRSWHAKSASHETAESLSKKRIPLNTDVFDITQFNEEHRTKYNGVTADFTEGNRTSDEQILADEEAERLAEQKKEERKKEEEKKKEENKKDEEKPKERKGLGKVLKSIFGKKKD
jgi:hypothetical protein